MASNENFSVNCFGEDVLLEALKKGDFSACLKNLEDGWDPFVPSAFGQCAGGMSIVWSEAMRDFVAKNGGFEKMYVDPRTSWKNCRATREPLAYTLPRLTGIHLAAACNDLDTILKNAKKVNELDAWGYQPIVYAIGNSHWSAMQRLLALGSWVDRKQGCLALDKRDIVSPGFYSLCGLSQIRPLIKASDPEQSQLKKAVTIHQAAAAGDMVMLRNLVELGVPVDVESFNGSTALMCAAIYGRTDACNYLLECGANPKKANFVDETPEQYLSTHGKPVMANQFRGQKSQLDKASGESRLDSAVADIVTGSGGTDDTSNGFNTEDLLKQFKKAATRGDFQTMVVAYDCLDESSVEQIPHDFVEIVRKLPGVANKEMIVSWLLVNGKGLAKSLMSFSYNSEMTAPEMAATGKPEIFLRYMREGNSISSGNQPLQAAVDEANPTLFRWLLRHGAAVFDFDVAVEPYRALASGKILERREAVRESPKKICDELLFALTTHNFELLLEYVDIGLDWADARTADGLQLTELAKLDDTKTLSAILVRLRAGEGTKEILREMAAGAIDDYAGGCIGTDDVVTESVGSSDVAPELSVVEPGSLPPENGAPSAESGFGGREAHELTGAELDWSMDDDDDEEIVVVEPEAEPEREPEREPEPVSGSETFTKIDDYGDGRLTSLRVVLMDKNDFEKVKHFLYLLPLPKIVIDHFLSLQNPVYGEREFNTIDIDEKTIELYRALKLYADDKFSQINDSDD